MVIETGWAATEMWITEIGEQYWLAYSRDDCCRCSMVASPHPLRKSEWASCVSA
ncbi:MAG: hypothetical protein ACJZ5B_01670 [Candidatus Poseidoniaceae archaeon]